jgi:hypothetical protein
MWYSQWRLRPETPGGLVCANVLPKSYRPDLNYTIHPIPSPNELPEVTKGAIAVYTDDATAALPPGWDTAGGLCPLRDGVLESPLRGALLN